MNQDWTWKSHYPDHNELRAYFEHIDKVLGIKKDVYFHTKVDKATWLDDEHKWSFECNTGMKVKATHFIASLGFAAKRHFPGMYQSWTHTGELC